MYKYKKCESNEYVKAGFLKSEQCYKCKKWDAVLFPQGIKKGVNKKKLLAVWMDAHGYSFRILANFFKVNVHSAFVWVKTFAKNNYSKSAPIDDSVIIELGEMWHFLRSKKTNLDLGRC